MSHNNIPTNLSELISETLNDKAVTNDSGFNSILKTLKKYHLWPALQIKKFKDNENLVLLHNSYKREDTQHFQNLYDQCRSVVIDLSLPLGQNTVVSYSYSIPIRIEYNEYETLSNPSIEKYQEAYDGTMITVYNYNGMWHFGTSCCTDVNSSKFPNPHKSHGSMLDEVLTKYLGEITSTVDTILNDDEKSIKLREKFTEKLNTVVAYEFVLLHHENIHIINYSDVLGLDYKELVHINSKDRVSLSEIDSSLCSLENLGIKYPKYYQNISDALSSFTISNTYGIIVKQYQSEQVRLYKISPKHISVKEETDPCNPNIWQNMLIVYMKNKQDYKISDYLVSYAPDLVLPTDDKGKTLDPTYIIHTMISTLKDVLYNLYILTTTYDSRTNRFNVIKDLDDLIPPILRFHLAQLRHRQITCHIGNILKPGQVYYYLCHCNNVKNIKLLIGFLANSSGYNIPEKAAICLSILNMLL